MRRDSTLNIFRVAIGLCLVCSFAVSLAAVLLRPIQKVNREDFKRRNVLVAAGLWEAGVDIDEAFKQIETILVDLNTGEIVSKDEVPPNINYETFDPLKATSQQDLSESLTSEEDIARIKRRENYTWVYLVKEGETVTQVVLPIRGYGLWSTLYGFLSLDAKSLAQGPDAVEIKGITYYQHGETPGLGAEVDNPKWKALWDGKRAYQDDWSVGIRVDKQASGEYEVDALAGATITSQGVTNMLKFWLGKMGFQQFLERYAEQVREQSSKVVGMN